MRRAVEPLDGRMVFVFGSPRSGTTFLAGAIGSCPGFVDLGEVAALKAAVPDLVRLGQASAALRIRRLLTLTRRLSMTGGLRAVEQTPETAFVCDAVARALPQSTKVHIIRDGRDVVCSLLERGWLSAGRAGADDAGLAFGSHGRFWVEPREGGRVRGGERCEACRVGVAPLRRGGRRAHGRRRAPLRAARSGFCGHGSRARACSRHRSGGTSSRARERSRLLGGALPPRPDERPARRRRGRRPESSSVASAICSNVSMFYPFLHRDGTQATSRTARPDRRGGARLLPSGPAPPVYGCGDRRRAAGQRPAPRPLADDAGVRERRGDDRSSADGRRALRELERREAPCGPRAAAVRDAGGPLAAAQGARRRARPGADRSKDLEARRGRMPSKSLYWHTFGSLSGGAAGGRLRRSGRRGAPRAGDRAGRRSWPGELGRLPKFADWARGTARAIRRC